MPQPLPRALVWPTQRSALVRLRRTTFSLVKVRVPGCSIRVAERNCVCVSRGGEQLEANCWSITRVNVIRSGGMAS